LLANQVGNDGVERSYTYDMTAPRWLLVVAASLLLGVIACANPPPIGTPPALTPYGFLSFATPTPGLRPTVIQPRLPRKKVSFHQPGHLVRWGGPDDAVSTKGGNHCTTPPEMKPLGMPEYVRVSTTRSSAPYDWFMAFRIVPRGGNWRWTGYYRGDWQIWQGDDSQRLYILNATEPGIAFEYVKGACA
jgi:hypothetical protein